MADSVRKVVLQNFDMESSHMRKILYEKNWLSGNSTPNILNCFENFKFIQL